MPGYRHAIDRSDSAVQDAQRDVHLVRGVAPALRIGGDVQVSGGPPLDQETLERFIGELLTDRQRQFLYDQMQLCFSRYWEGVGRCRVTTRFRARNASRWAWATRRW